MSIGVDYGASSSSWSGSPSRAEGCVSASAYTPEPEEPDCEETTREEGRTVTNSKQLRIEDYHDNYNTTIITATASSDDRSKTGDECEGGGGGGGGSYNCYVNVSLTNAEGRVTSIYAEGQIDSIDGDCATASWELQYRGSGSTGSPSGWQTFGSGSASEGDSFSETTDTNCDSGAGCEYDIRAKAELSNGYNEYSGTRTVTTGESVG